MKVKKYLFIIAIYILGVFMPNYVSAETLYIGQEEIKPGETKNIYGGTVKFEEESSDYILTLKDVTIDEYNSFSPETGYGIYFEDGNLTIKLEGDNKIKFANDDKSLIESYYGINTVDNTLSIIGNGILSFDCKIYMGVIYAIMANNINVGNDSSKVKIYANLNQVDKNGETDYVENMLMFGTNNINIKNAYIKSNIKASVGSFIWLNSNLSIKNSDLEFTGMAALQLKFLYSMWGLVDIDDSDILLKGLKPENTDDIFISGISGDYGNINDSRIIIIYDNPDPDDNFSLSYSNIPNDLNLTHVEGKDFLIVANCPINHYSVNFTGITNKMVYVSNISLDTVKQSDTYDLNNLLNEKYFVIKSNSVVINNAIIDGNNQKLKENNITSYSFLTNHYKNLVKSIKLGNQQLDTEDYLLSLDGKVSFTDSGLEKLSKLSVGSYKIDIDYIYGNSISVNFDIVENISEVVDIPETGDNIYISILLSLISIICFAVIYLRKRKINKC